ADRGAVHCRNVCDLRTERQDRRLVELGTTVPVARSWRPADVSSYWRHSAGPIPRFAVRGDVTGTPDRRCPGLRLRRGNRNAQRRRGGIWLETPGGDRAE